MTVRSRRGLPGLILTAVLALALGLAACGGGSDNSGGSSSSSGGSSSTGGAKKGGTITVLDATYPDFIDPGLAYLASAWQSLHMVYPGLVTFPAKSGQAGAQVVPGLAEALPKISADGKTYTFQLRKGLKFSDGSPLKAKDFKWSIERLLKQDSQGAGLGFTNIVGGAEYLKSKKGGVTGIEADDATGKIVIKLAKPRGAFLYELAIPFAGVVPRSTPAKNMTKDPPPGAGRYVYNKVVVNRSYALVRNKNFSPALKGTAVDVGNADTFNLLVERNSANAAAKVAQGRADFMIPNPPPGSITDLKARFGPGTGSKQRLEQFPTNSSYYFFMNTEAPPFDKLKVRQAVNYAMDPNAINRVQGGVISPSNTILPPGVPGHRDWPNLYPHNLAKAKQLIKEAGATGAKVTVWGSPGNPTQPTVEYYASVLKSIGLDAKTKIVSSETYFTTIADRKTKAQTGWDNWSQDYPHPSDFIDVLLNPDNVVDTGNNNQSYNAKDKALAKQINELSAEPKLTPDVMKRWGDLDREIQKKAYWAVYGNRKQTTFFSSRMDFKNCKGEHSVYTSNWAMFCLK
jgi:peptide/nickel transport system substrate-binding protein